MVKPVDVLLPIFPARGAELVFALLGMIEDVCVLHRLDEVDMQISKISLGNLCAAPEFDFSYGRALVELGVADLFEILGAEVVVIKLVPVVVLAIADVRIEEVEVGEERDDGQRDCDPTFRPLRDAFA